MISNWMNLCCIGVLLMFLVPDVHVQEINNNRTQFNGSVFEKDAIVAESQVPLKYVSSGYKDGREEGFSTKSNFKDGDGYDTFETYGDHDKDKFGFVSESGYGKRKSGGTDQKPKVAKHSYKKVQKDNGDWEFKNAGGVEEESHEETKGSKTRTYKQKHDKPVRFYRSNPPKLASLMESPTEKLYDFSMTYPSSYNHQTHQIKSLPPLTKLTDARKDIYPSHETSGPTKRGISHLTDYVLASHEDVEPAPVEEPSKKVSKAKRKAIPKNQKKDKKNNKKSAKYSEYDGLDLNDDASIEHDDGGESGADYDNNDYADNDYVSGEANEGADYEEEENDGGEEESAEGNDYDYEANDYDDDEGAEGEDKKRSNKKRQDEDDGAEYDEDSEGEYSQNKPDFIDQFIYASEADKDASYL